MADFRTPCYFLAFQALVFFLLTSCCSTQAFLLPPYHKHHAHERLLSKNGRGIATWKTRHHNTPHLIIGAVASFDTDVTASSNENIVIPGNNDIRPLHTNWWPVTLKNALKDDRPNAIMVLGMRLVLFHDGESWKCLDDQCAHRFAPLSEGRVIPTSEASGKNHLQCAYHGWEFDGCGACQCIPQALSNSKDPSLLRKSKVQSYPVREACGLLWVWTDPETAESTARSIQLPISPLLKLFHAENGDSIGFMRDLPYGTEFLGENLVDPSHLPFSHHSVGNLHRGLGGPLPFRMLPESEKLDVAIGEQQNVPAEFRTTPSENVVLPRFQVTLPNAGQYDPMLKSSNEVNGTLHLGFYEPAHIRYRRKGKRFGNYNVEIFICPLDSGRSRVFQFNTFQLPVSSKTSENVVTGRVALLLLSPIKAWLNEIKTRRIKTKFQQASVRSHMISHQIFDGDGIFLHKQGERMRRSGKTFRNYEQPYAADVLLNAYRRYLDVAATKSLERGHLLASQSVSGVNYLDNEPRSTLLDRYESHTKHCPVCQEGLRRCRQREAMWNVVRTAMIGAAGASSAAFVVTLVSSPFLLGAALPFMIWRVLGASTVFTMAGSVLAGHQKIQAEHDTKKFIFEDYVHADKD